MTREEFNKIFNAFMALNPDELDCVEFVMNLEKEYGIAIPDEWIPMYPYQDSQDTLTEFEQRVKVFLNDSLSDGFNLDDNDTIRDAAKRLLQIASEKMVPKEILDEYERNLNDKIEDWRYDGMAEESVGLAAARDMFEGLRTRKNI
jgi:acyl carrier protein